LAPIGLRVGTESQWHLLCSARNPCQQKVGRSRDMTSHAGPSSEEVGMPGQFGDRGSWSILKLGDGHKPQV